MNARELRDAASPNGQLAYQLERAGIGFVREHSGTLGEWLNG